MAVNVASLEATVGLNDSGFQAGVKSVDSSLNQTEQKLNQTGRAFTDFSQKVSAVDPKSFRASQFEAEFNLVRSATASTNAAVTNLQKSVAAIDPRSVKAAQFAAEFNLARAATKDEDEALKGLNRTLETTKTKLRETADQARFTSADFRSLGMALSISVTAPLTALAVASARTAITFDSLRRGLDAVNVSGKTVDQQLGELREVAKLPGLGFKDAIEGSIRLQAAGISADTAKEALMGFGNALASVGKGKAELEGVTRALSQIQTKGKVTAEEINQLAERVPQIRKVMQDAFGTADTEALQAMGLKSEDFIEQITVALGKLPKVTGGIKNDIENFTDSIEQDFAKLGTAMLPLISRALTPIADIVENISEAFTRLSPAAQQNVIIVGALVAALGPAVLIFAALSDALEKSKRGFAALADMRTRVIGTISGTTAAVEKEALASTASTAATGRNAVVSAETAAVKRVLVRTVEDQTVKYALSTQAVNAESLALGQNAGASATSMRSKLGAGVGRFMGVGIGAALGGQVIGGAIQATKFGMSEANQQGQPGMLADIGSSAFQWGGAGAALGSFFPGVGTAVGAGIGAVGGAAYGVWGHDKAVAEAGQRRVEEMQAELAAQQKAKQQQRDFEAKQKADLAPFQKQELADLQTSSAMTRARSEAEKAPEGSRAGAEFAALKPIIDKQIESIKRQMADLKPQMEGNFEKSKQYYELEKDYYKSIEAENQLANRAQKEKETNIKKTADAAKKQVDEQKRISDLAFRAAESQAQARAINLAEDERAQSIAREMVPLLQQKQEELRRESEQLLPSVRTNTENAKRYYEILSEYWGLESQAAQLNYSARQEAERAQEKAGQDAKQLAESARSAERARAQAEIAELPDSDRPQEEARRYLPVLEQQQQELLAELAQEQDGTKKYYEIEKQYWDLERESGEIKRRGIKQEQDNVKRAQDEARKAAKEETDLTEARIRLIEAQSKNNPFLTEQQKRRQIVPLLLEELRQLARPVQGETELESINRQIEGEGLKTRILESLGMNKKPVKLLGGGQFMPFNVREMQGAMQEFARIEAEALSDPVQPRSAAEARKPLEYEIESSGDRAAVSDHKDRDIQDAEAMAKRAANNAPIVYQTVLQPGSMEELRSFYDAWFDDMMRRVYPQATR